MEKLTSWIIAAMLLTIVVFAAGGGGGGGGSSRSSVKADSVEPSKHDCEKILGLQERISCRLDQKLDNKGLPEACRESANPIVCQKLYDDSLPCYETIGLSKDRCLRRVSGFDKQHGAMERRNYLVLLLYDLEERVEEGVEEGKIAPEQATLLITRITLLKKQVLALEPKEKLEAPLAALKKNWNEAMPK